jgi:antitoxin (DNA-binding transcriptional repressor) of toxin-antitoxin stability system
MKTITLRELHQATGRWLRLAQTGEVYVTERGQLIAKIVSVPPSPAQPFFARPSWTRAFLRERKHLHGGTDSTAIVAEHRDREVRRSTGFPRSLFQPPPASPKTPG